MSVNASSSVTPFAKPLLLAPLIVLCLGLLPLPQQGQIANLPAFCPFLFLTSLPCPFCGLTRSLVCCAHNQWNAAWHYHALGPLFFAFLLLSSTRLMVEWVAAHCGFSSAFERFRLNRKGRAGLAWTVVLLITAAWIIRLAHWWPLPS